MSKHNNKNWWDKNSMNKKQKEEPKQVVELRKEVIEHFTEMLRIRALYDDVYVDIVHDTRKQRLDIYSHYDNVCVHTQVGVHYIVSDRFRIGDIVYDVYETIKENFIYSFEEIENKQKEESEIDEHWEHMPY